MAHTCNPVYSGGRDQEDPGLKPARGKKFMRPYLKNTQHKKACGVAQGEGPDFKPQYHTHKNISIIVLSSIKFNKFQTREQGPQAPLFFCGHSSLNSFD
jgi:hypothetical protein